MTAGAAAAAPAQGLLAEHRRGAAREARRGDRPGRLHHFSGRHDERAARQAAGAARAELGGGHGQPDAGGRGRSRVHGLPERAEARQRGSAIRCARPSCSSRDPAERLGRAPGRCSLLVVGGSLGAKALNEIVPKALALIPAGAAPVGDCTRAAPSRSTSCAPTTRPPASQAELTPFIDDTARAFAEADLIVCRAGASTVTEIAAVGAAAVFVPFPSAVDDHQTTNAQLPGGRGRRLAGAADATSRPQWLADLLQNTAARRELIRRALAAKTHAARPSATRAEMVARLRGAGKSHETRDQAHSFRRHRRRRHVAASPKCCATWAT